MMTVTSILKAMVVRVSRGEARRATQALRKSTSELRRESATLRRRCAELERQLRKLSGGRVRTGAAVEVAADPVQEGEPTQAARPTGKMIRSLRKRLALSRRQFGVLMGVSGQSVLLWEQRDGRLRMRHANRRTLLQLRQMGKRDVLKALEAAGG